MADNNNTDKFVLDLDAKAFIEEAMKAKSAISSLGSSEELAELAEGLLHAGAAVGVLGVALFAIKETVDLVFDAEKIKQTEQQFENLSEQAGIYGEKLKEALVESTKGRVDEITLLKAANKALVELETGYEKIPELMELARKATAVMGGDTVQNFEAISQAVASGQTRQLRHLGIIIDQEKAMRDYAASIGVTVDALSLAGKQQAILNAALEKGQERFKGGEQDVKQATNAWAAFKTSIVEIKDTLVLAFDSVLGPTVVKFFQNLQAMAADAKTWIKGNFGQGADAAAAKFELLQDRVLQLKGRLVELDQLKMKGIFNPGEYASVEQALKRYQTQLAEVSKTNIALQEKSAEKEKEVESKKTQAQLVDLEKQKKQRAEVAGEIAKIDAELVHEQGKNLMAVEQATAHYYAHLRSEGAKVDQQIEAVRAKQAQGAITAAQANAQIVRLNQLKNQRMKVDDEALWKEQKKALDNYVHHSQGAFDAVGRSFKKAALEAQHDIKTGMKIGETAVTSFSRNATSNMEAWGAGTKSATEAIGGMFAGMAGDMASQYGEMMMLAAVWPPNPPAFAAGTALVALGGFLKSLAGGSSKGGDVGAGAGGSAPGDVPAAKASVQGPTSEAATNAQQHKSVTLQIQGHMFMNDQTQRWLVDQIRAAADATDFKIQSVGGGL